MCGAGGWGEGSILKCKILLNLQVYKILVIQGVLRLRTSVPVHTFGLGLGFLKADGAAVTVPFGSKVEGMFRGLENETTCSEMWRHSVFSTG